HGEPHEGIDAPDGAADGVGIQHRAGNELDFGVGGRRHVEDAKRVPRLEIRRYQLADMARAADEKELHASALSPVASTLMPRSFAMRWNSAPTSGSSSDELPSAISGASGSSASRRVKRVGKSIRPLPGQPSCRWM